MSNSGVEGIKPVNMFEGFDTTEASHLWARFSVNLNRCIQLVRHGYDLHKKPETEELADEILRAAVVMLHATFEDYLRSLTRFALPKVAAKTALNKLKFPGSAPEDRRPDSISVAELAVRYKDKTVQEVIDMAVDSYCKRLTISSVDDFEQLLKRLGRDPIPLRYAYPILSWMMERRHRIAHEADIILMPPDGGFGYLSLWGDGDDADGQRRFSNLINCLRDVCLNGLHPWFCGVLANQLDAPADSQEKQEPPK